MSRAMTRPEMAAFAGMILARRFAAHMTGHEQGANDAALGRVYGHSRSTFTDRNEYDLGWRVGRFVRFANLPAWRAGMLTDADAAEMWRTFKATIDARPDDPD